MVIVDVVGIPVTVGSTVTYPVRQGSNMWVNSGEVVGLDYVKNRVKVERNGRRFWVTADRITYSIAHLLEGFNNAG